MSLVSTPTMNDVDPIVAPSTGAATGAAVGTANSHATDATKMPSTTSVVDRKEGGVIVALFWKGVKTTVDVVWS